MAEDRSKPLPSYPAPPFSYSPSAIRMSPPLESSHHPAAAAASTVASDQRRVFSKHPRTPPIPQTHGYPIVFNQELLQLPPKGPCGHLSSLLGSTATAPNAHHHHLPPPSGNYRVNDTVAGAPSYSSHHGAPPHSAPSESTNVGTSAHSIPHAPYITPTPAPILQTPAPFDAHYQRQEHGMRWRKAPRAQLVRHTERGEKREPYWRSDYTVTDSSRLASNVGLEGPNVMKGDHHVVIARKTICPVFTKTRCCFTSA